MTRNRLERRVRYLTMYAGGSTLLFLLLTVAAFSSGRVGAWKEVKADSAKLDTLRAGHIEAEPIEAERIDIVEPDGKLALAMANTKRT